mgnify:CR=1 FL=1
MNKRKKDFDIKKLPYEVQIIMYLSLLKCYFGLSNEDIIIKLKEKGIIK